MAPPFKRHLFVCTNRRPDGHPKGCCASKGSEEIRAAFKAELEKRGLKGQMRANAAGCLDTCSYGISIVVYPEGTWYGGLTMADVPTGTEEELVGGRPVERVMMKFSRKARKVAEPQPAGPKPMEPKPAGS